MGIGWPTDVQHLTHVTLDQFHGCLGLLVELQVEIPCRVPSARFTLLALNRYRAGFEELVILKKLVDADIEDRLHEAIMSGFFPGLSTGIIFHISHSFPHSLVTHSLCFFLRLLLSSSLDILSTCRALCSNPLTYLEMPSFIQSKPPSSSPYPPNSSTSYFLTDEHSDADDSGGLDEGVAEFSYYLHFSRVICSPNSKILTSTCIFRLHKVQEREFLPNWFRLSTFQTKSKISHKKSTMERRFSTIMDIQPGMKNPWTVLVQVVEPGHMQTSKAGSNFRRLLLTDSQGTNTTAVIYAAHIRFFLKTFKPYKRYYISNAVVTKADPRFLVSAYLHSWTLNSRTLVEEHIEQIPPILPCTFQFTPFTELAKHAETESHQNVQAIVVRCFPSEEQEHVSGVITKQDVVIVNREERPIILTLWNHFADNEGKFLENLIDPPAMIFGLRLKVSSFNGLSLTTRNGSGILINPPVSEDLQLNNWPR
ncbi:hypothetical protein L6452_38495 [Arctium lappa]|uniref:Uncharacterized protein n=1 Tax=Arctium lappa TaxID=4217 RepID=A0ACB8XRE8_ARCLA|nr:hypothetical protein L6452_38495 [Arctium lappa]